MVRGDLHEWHSSVGICLVSESGLKLLSPTTVIEDYARMTSSKGCESANLLIRARHSRLQNSKILQRFRYQRGMRRLILFGEQCPPLGRLLGALLPV